MKNGYMNKNKVDPLDALSNEDLKFVILVHSAFVGASVAAVVEMGGRQQLSLALLVSLACFAIAIPISLLVVLLLNYRALNRTCLEETQHLLARHWPDSWIVQALRYLSYTASFGGFLALFWDYHAVIGLIFLLMSAVAFGIALAAEQHKLKETAEI